MRVHLHPRQFFLWKQEYNFVIKGISQKYDILQVTGKKILKTFFFLFKFFALFYNSIILVNLRQDHVRCSFMAPGIKRANKIRCRSTQFLKLLKYLK